MSYYPPQPPNGGPPMQYGSQPPGPPRAGGKVGPLLGGAVISVLVNTLGLFGSIAVVSRLDLGIGAWFLPAFLTLVGGVVMLCIERTRFWGLGLLIGFFLSIIIGAGACFVILASYSAG